MCFVVIFKVDDPVFKLVLYHRQHCVLSSVHRAAKFQEEMEQEANGKQNRAEGSVLVFVALAPDFLQLFVILQLVLDVFKLLVSLSSSL